MRGVVAQAPPVLPDGDEVAREELVRHLRRLRERRDLAAPAGHADARLDRAPAVRGAGTGLLRHERLVEPAGDHVDPHGDGLLVAGGGVVFGERRPERVARELPRPLLVLVERGVQVPVHLVVGEVVGHAAGRKAIVHDLPGAALERAQRLALVFPLEPVLVERVVPQRGAHVVREHLLGAGEVARGHLRGDGRQRGDGRVKVFREELLGRGARTGRARGGDAGNQGDVRDGASVHRFASFSSSSVTTTGLWSEVRVSEMTCVSFTFTRADAPRSTAM